ncbi:MAG: hypothetical protein QOJ27_857 [Sphingomonadales bacterium]|jgi:hypothetical protein|nr:hypothetical protein [Sphingomonadales bacterium]
MSRPPQATPHSDIDGVHRDEKPNVESAVEAGQGTEDLARAQEETPARPDHATDVRNRDDRSQ